ncbi:SDR family NAD(P)-dependent oxidoreductase [Bradyrhizobium manausense]|uniref:Short-chain dehydrogenase n=1 Tax=Bradyrhizobium manausense TaxID=989370 RepID=A0A0R3DNV0_9BRAD|nr:SDR family NAD(P)-dependent oxidoreductase [Bradyrhizobium manausense]KRQ08981.1 hypothetical protein AOQ71_21600 [Bradyrhizobium manausense]
MNDVSISQRFRGRRALVTGAAGDLGAAIAKRLSSEGARVAVWDKNSNGLDIAFGSAGGDTFLKSVVDLRSERDVKQAAAGVLDAFGGVDIVVNNAGGALDRPYYLLDQTEEDWVQTIDLNLYTAVRVTKAFIGAMSGAGYGRVINLGSKAGRYSSYIDGPAYCAAKGAVHAFTLSLAMEFGPKGVTANAVLPGLIMTERVRKLWEFRRPLVEREAIKKAIPLQHHGDLEDISGAVAFLASDDAKFITGTLLDLNGGQSMAT